MVKVHLSLTEEERDKLQQVAREQERSQAAVVRIALRRYYKQLEKEGG